jgi:hypothetical protein
MRQTPTTMRQPPNEKMNSNLVVQGHRQPVRARSRGWQSSAAKESFLSLVARPRELDIESPRRPPERPLSFTSAANVRLGACFVVHKLSQRLPSEAKQKDAAPRLIALQRALFYAFFSRTISYPDVQRVYQLYLSWHRSSNR